MLSTGAILGLLHAFTAIQVIYFWTCSKILENELVFSCQDKLVFHRAKLWVIIKAACVVLTLHRIDIREENLINVQINYWKCLVLMPKTLMLSYVGIWQWGNTETFGRMGGMSFFRMTESQSVLWNHACVLRSFTPPFKHPSLPHPNRLHGFWTFRLEM